MTRANSTASQMEMGRQTVAVTDLAPEMAMGMFWEASSMA